MASDQTAGETYTHGYHDVIIDSYTKRSAETHAAFLLPHLDPDAEVLDVGSGPGTISIGLARRSRSVIGVDTSKKMVQRATAAAEEAGVANLTFQTGSAYRLPFDASSFDVVFAHQVLQHLYDPVRVLREMRRVLRPGGIVAVRDSDYQTMVHAPVEPALEHWLRLYLEVTEANRGEARAGRFLLSWVMAARFENPLVTTTSTMFADPEARAAWGNMWAVRVTDSDFAEHAVSRGLASRSDLVAISAAFKRWAESPTGFWAYLCGEVIAFKPSD